MSRLRPGLSALVPAIVALAGQAHAAPGEPTTAETGAEAPLSLQLEVYRNGAPTGLIAAFSRLPDGRFAAAPSELRAIGLSAPPGEQPVALETLPGVAYRYDDPQQRMLIEARPAAIVPLKISLRERFEGPPPSEDFGGVINYAFSGGVGRDHGDALHGQALSAAVEARVFGSFGMLSTGAVATASSDERRVVRLDTAWTWARPESAATLRVGDSISGGFAWSRPVRMAGLQWRRDFATRPDLIITPNVTLAASAAAPSTLEVMLGSSVLMSRQVSEGPIEVTDLPIVQGHGEARLVLRDQAGVAQSVVAAYFTTPELLRKGLVDYSLEAGFARRSYGLASADYDPAPLGSGSVRYGWTDAVTMQAHVEAGDGLINAGLGAAGRIGALGVASVAAAHSRRDGREGALFAAAFQTHAAAVVLSAQAQRTFGAYRDLAATTARPGPLGMAAALPPRTLLQLALSAPLDFGPFARSTRPPVVSVAYGGAETASGNKRSLLSGSLRHQTGFGAAVQMAAFASMAGRRDRGLFVSVNTPLGPRHSASAGVDRSGGRTAAYGETRREEIPDTRSWAWRLRAEQAGEPRVEAEVVYRSEVGRIAVRATQGRGSTQLEGRVDGGLVWLDGLMFAPDRVEGAFAVVEAGAPRVQVLQDNRPVGRSNRHGRLLARNLDPYGANALSLDETGVPLDFSAALTRVSVSPPYGAGALVRFDVSRAAVQGLVSLYFADGDPAPAGARATLLDGGDEVLVGYDGLAFVVSKSAQNGLKVDLGDGRTCTAHFTLPIAANGLSHVSRAICS